MVPRPPHFEKGNITPSSTPLSSSFGLPGILNPDIHEPSWITVGALQSLSNAWELCTQTINLLINYIAQYENNLVVICTSHNFNLWTSNFSCFSSTSSHTDRVRAEPCHGSHSTWSTWNREISASQSHCISYWCQTCKLCLSTYIISSKCILCVHCVYDIMFIISIVFELICVLSLVWVWYCMSITATHPGLRWIRWEMVCMCIVKRLCTYNWFFFMLTSV